ERQDGVLQRARGDRHLPGDRDAGGESRRLRDGETGALDPPRGGADGRVPPRADQIAERRRRPGRHPGRAAQTGHLESEKTGAEKISGEKTRGEKSAAEKI